jgi:hypothetical protein
VPVYVAFASSTAVGAPSPARHTWEARVRKTPAREFELMYKFFIIVGLESNCSKPYIYYNYLIYYINCLAGSN